MVLNIAHRGARSLAPENTLAAARKAYEAGAHLWETDVTVTKDEVLVLFHDDYPGRTTNAAAVFPDRPNHRLQDYLFSEIRQLNAASFFEATDPFGTIETGEVTPADQEAFQGESIPSLAEALQLTQDLQWQINLELKGLPESKQDFPMVESVLDILSTQRFDLTNLVISSFHHQWLRDIHARQPEITLQALIGHSVKGPLDWGGFEFSIYNARSTLITFDALQEAKKRGVAVNLFTVNDEQEMQRLIQAGASGLITDYPQRLARIIGPS